jgi:hypothetical protein
MSITPSQAYLPPAQAEAELKALLVDAAEPKHAGRVDRRTRNLARTLRLHKMDHAMLRLADLLESLEASHRTSRSHSKALETRQALVAFLRDPDAQSSLEPAGGD